MSFSARLKDEICLLPSNPVSLYSELNAIIRYDALISKDFISFTFENPAVARRVFRDIKQSFNISCHVSVRRQKRLRAKAIYIIEIKEQIDSILERFNIVKDGKRCDLTLDYFADPEEMSSFVRGVFLVRGSITDPSTSGYHLEYVFNKKKDALFVQKLLKEMKFNLKMVVRSGRYLLYLKSSEEISDMIRMFEASNALFYFEDVRIYRDHKNMVNRLNNCEIANQEKSTKTGLKQIQIINDLKEYDIYDLLDEKTKLVLDFRLKYPESSYNELASIIEMEVGYKIGKSGINHHFIRAKKLLESYLENN